MLQDPGLCVNQNHLLGKTCTRNLYTINYLHIIDKGEPEEEDKRMAIMGSFFNVVKGDSYQSPPS